MYERIIKKINNNIKYTFKKTLENNYHDVTV